MPVGRELQKVREAGEKIVARYWEQLGKGKNILANEKEEEEEGTDSETVTVDKPESLKEP